MRYKDMIVSYRRATRALNANYDFNTESNNRYLKASHTRSFNRLFNYLTSKGLTQDEVLKKIRAIK